MFNKIRRRWTAALAGTVAAVMVAGAAIAAAPVPAFADQGTPPTPPAPGNGGLVGRGLERIYQREQTVLANQADHIAKADEITSRIQGLIDQLAASGKDVSGLQAALDDFQTSLSEAQSQHDQAAGILKTHAGFDANGKVTDRQAAVDTVRQAGQSLRDWRQTMRQAIQQLRNAIRQWRQANRPQGAPSGPAAAPTSAG